MGGVSLELVGIEIENLRGFEQASLNLEPDISLLVGPNNSGKTSLLRMLDWVFNAPLAQFESSSPVPSEVEDLLRPARDTRNRARRFALMVRVTDGRRHARFRCVAGIATLRVGLRLSPAASLRVNLGPPTRNEGANRDDDAYELLEELRETIEFRLIPATRDAASTSFGGALDRALTRRLAEGAVHERWIGAAIPPRASSNGGRPRPS